MPSRHRLAHLIEHGRTVDSRLTTGIIEKERIAGIEVEIILISKDKLPGGDRILSPLRAWFADPAMKVKTGPGRFGKIDNRNSIEIDHGPERKDATTKRTQCARTSAL